MNLLRHTCALNYRFNRWLDREETRKMYIVLIIIPVLCGLISYGAEGGPKWLFVLSFLLLMLICISRAAAFLDWCKPRPIGN